MSQFYQASACDVLLLFQRDARAGEGAVVVEGEGLGIAAGVDADVFAVDGVGGVEGCAADRDGCLAVGFEFDGKGPGVIRVLSRDGFAAPGGANQRATQDDNHENPTERRTDHEHSPRKF